VTSLTTLPRVLRIMRRMRCSLLNSSLSMDIYRCELQEASLAGIKGPKFELFSACTISRRQCCSLILTAEPHHETRSVHHDDMETGLLAIQFDRSYRITYRTRHLLSCPYSIVSNKMCPGPNCLSEYTNEK
jgi:hypothetical protein